MTVTSLLLIAVLALLVGTLMGLLGGGGGFLYVLVLLAATDVAAGVAVGTGVVVATAGAAVSLLAHHRAGTVDWRRTRGFLLPGAAGAVAAGLLVSHLPHGVLVGLVVAAYALVGLLPLGLARRGGGTAPAAGPADPAPPAGVPSVARRRAGRAAVGAVAGIAVGAFAVNGGALISGYLAGYERLDPHRGIATAVAVLTPFSAVGAITHLAVGSVHLGLALVLAPGAVAGGYLGARLARLVRGRVLAPTLGLLALATTIPLILR